MAAAAAGGEGSGGGGGGEDAFSVVKRRLGVTENVSQADANALR